MYVQCTFNDYVYELLLFKVITIIITTTTTSTVGVESFGATKRIRDFRRVDIYDVYLCIVSCIVSTRQ